MFRVNVLILDAGRRYQLRTYTGVLHLAKRMSDVVDFTEDFVDDFVLAMPASGETSGAS